MQRSGWMGLMVFTVVGGLGWWLVSPHHDGANRNTAQIGPSDSLAVEAIGAEETSLASSAAEDETSFDSTVDVPNVFPAGDVVRFAPDAWPPLPADDRAVREVLDDMLTRAEQGDASADCWLGVKLRRCGSVLARARQLTAIDERSVQQAKTISDQVAALGRQAEYLETLAVCQGLRPELLNRGLDFTRQAAVAGSRVAIAEMVAVDGFSEPGFPEAAVIRRTLDEREAFVWAGVMAGIPEALHQLTLGSEQFALYNLQSPKVPRASGDDLLATRFLLYELTSAMIKEQPELLHDPQMDHVMSEGSSLESRLTGSRRRRIQDIVRGMDVSTWSMPDTDEEPADTFRTAQSSCREFGDPVDLSLSLKDVVSP